MEVIIDEIIEGDGAGGEVGGEGDGDVIMRLGLRGQEVHMLSSQVLHLRRELADTQAKHVRQLGIIRGQLTRLNRNFLLFANRPAITSSCPRQPFHHNAMEEEEIPLRHDQQQPPREPRMGANLLKCQRMLNDLWREYEFGMCGNKPATDFTPHERGQVKVAYCWRKVFWDKVAELIRAGFTADEAIDKSYRAYGERLPVSAILTKMTLDWRNGGILVFIFVLSKIKMYQFHSISFIIRMLHWFKSKKHKSFLMV